MSSEAVLTTPRLVLRELEGGDRDALHRVLGDADTMVFYPSAFSIERTADWIEWNRASYRDRGYGLWALVFDGELVGDCGLTRQDVEGEQFVEVGWHVRRDLWGRGLATEAAAACRELAFGGLGLDVLVSLVRPENGASCRVAEKIGMSVWKTLPRGPQGWLHRVYRIVNARGQAPALT